MIHVYKEGKDRVIDIVGMGAEVLNDFSALCGTLVNNIEEVSASTIPEDKIVSMLSLAMAQGISERKTGRKVDD